jgi:hypothetical protein
MKAYKLILKCLYATDSRYFNFEAVRNASFIFVCSKNCLICILFGLSVIIDLIYLGAYVSAVTQGELIRSAINQADIYEKHKFHNIVNMIVVFICIFMITTLMCLIVDLYSTPHCILMVGA